MNSKTKNNKLVLTTFLNELSNFIDQLCEMFPPSKDLTANKAYFISCKKVNPRVVLITWYTDIALHFKDYVETGDLTFFSTHDYQNDTQLKNYSPLIIRLFETIKYNIVNLVKDKQTIIITYIQNLSKISALYVQ